MSGREDVLAGQLYTRYCQAVGGVAFNGEPLPSWAAFSTDPLKTKQADGWRAVAVDLLTGNINLRVVR